MYNNLYTTNNYVTLKIIVKAKISIYISNLSLLHRLELEYGMQK